jgi:P-type conjugative transfer protein TrbL
MRGFILATLLAVTVAFVTAPSVSSAADGKILDTVIEKYNTAAKGWEPVLKQAATRLFLALCVISLVFTAGFGFIRGGMGLGDFFAEFLRFGITMGVFYWLLNNGPVIAKSLIDSMTTLGQTASSTYLVKLTPSDICTQGFGLIYDAVAEFGKSDYATGVMVIVIALMIALVFAVIAAQMVVLLCSSWILIYGGVFYLGFGGGSWTSDIAKNYFKTVLAQAMQVFTFCLLLGIGQKEIISLTAGLRTTKNVVVANNWWLFGLGGEATRVVQSETLTLTGMCVALVFAVILCILVSRVPGLVAGVINGSSISAMSFGGVGGAMRSATGMATGAGMMLAQATGAGMALSSAYKAMQDHKANGEGAFAKGAATTGLKGMFHSVTDMAANLSEGGYGVRQRQTSGGMAASHIDGMVQQRQAEREKEKAKTEAAATPDATLGGMTSEPDSAEPNGDGDESTAPSEDAEAASGAAEAGGQEQSGPFDGGSGDLSGPPAGGDAAGDEAPPDTSWQGAPDGAGGSYHDEQEQDDEIESWRAEIENYDPGKSGLPDGG